ncbi:S-adenosyl-L-methionine-dependent methyltransferase [Aspergillus crustosus]
MPSQTEQTFRDYTPEQGKSYAQNRLDYHPALYSTIIAHHTSTGGQLNSLIDLGTGPGNVAQNLSKHFTKTTGLDPSQGMIETARSLADPDALAQGKIAFEVSTAEEIGRNLTPPIADGSVDLIVAATAAHWFDMPKFWQRAARVLKPGGSVAIWGSGNLRVDRRTPNAAAIDARVEEFEEEMRPFFLPGNLMTRGLYKELGLPWTVEPAVKGFEEGSFLRKEWDGVDEFLAKGQPEVDLGKFEKMIGTMSPVTRWREAHPEAVGTDEDIVRRFRRDVERLLREAGQEEGKETIRGSAQGFLLIVKREKQ